jgi:hypothetical protein
MKWDPRCIKADAEEAEWKSEFSEIELIQNRELVTAGIRRNESPSAGS